MFIKTQPMQMGSMQTGLFPAMSTSQAGIDINSIFNIMLMVMVMGMMGKAMMGSASNEPA